MSIRYAIHPAVGVARVGNSPSFYLAPVTIGGLPIECDEDGTMSRDAAGDPRFVESFKQDARIRPQAARFTIYAHDDERGTRREVTLDDADIESIEWTVHLANKKSCWYLFEQRAGDLSLGPANTYAALNIPLRNPTVTGAGRANLIVDPGPRTVRDREARANFTAAESNGYPCRFPEPIAGSTPVTTLGKLHTDHGGRLLVIGGPGAASGPVPDPAPFAAFIAARAKAAAPPDEHAPANEPPGWYDDAGDGPVTCTISFKDPAKSATCLRAWCIVGPPKYAPELVNMVTLDDVMLDVAVERFGFLSLADGAAPGDFVVNYDRDIAPIVERCAQASWSTGVPMAAATGYPKFDPRDASEANRRNRERYARQFRRDPTRFFDANGVPMLPLHAGSNMAGSNACFDTLTGTQLQMLRLWAAGRFTTAPAAPLRGVDALDRASVGNCVGSPMDPGIEATWSLRDPAIYEAPWRIKHRHPPDHYRTSGLSLDANEQDGKGCEPGDLTKRLIAPWQWDFANCASEDVALSDAELRDMPGPPRYEVAWWPAQRPVRVVHGRRNDEDGALKPGALKDWDRMTSGPIQMSSGWTRLGFVVNQNRVDGAEYPHFAEVERQDIRSGPTAFDVAYLAYRRLR